MKKLVFIFIFSLTSIQSFAFENQIDLELHCRSIKENEYFRSFSLRLRKVDLNYKLVKGSTNSRPFFEYIKTLEMNPVIEVNLMKYPSGYDFINEIKIGAGDQSTERSTALLIKSEDGILYTGRLQSWWPNQSSSLSEKISCLISNEWTNGRPTID